jgi:hypothetical protein
MLYCITFKKDLFFDDKSFMIMKKKIKTQKLIKTIILISWSVGVLNGIGIWY